MKERIVGHRGAGILAPENTVHALEKAAGLGLTHVEFDVRLSKDHVPVISHDDSLKRCAHIDQLISETDYKDLQIIDMGRHYALYDITAPLPRFDEYLKNADRLGLHCQVELKPNKGEENTLVNIAADMLDHFYADTPEDNLPLITSFVPACLKHIKASAKRPYKTGVLVKVEDSIDWQDAATASECDFVHMHALYLKDNIASAIRGAGYGINGFHLNHPETARRAISLGCQRFTCDIPDVFLNAFEFSV